MHSLLRQFSRAAGAALLLRHHLSMSYIAIGAGGLLALCLYGYGSAIATVLGAAIVSPGALPSVAPAEEGGSDRQSTRSKFASWMGFYNPFVSTTAALSSAALLFKGASMIETGARATWTFGGDRFPRDLVDVSTLLRFLAVAAVGWQGLRMLKTYAHNPQAIADTVSQSGAGTLAETAAGAAGRAAKAALGGSGQRSTESRDEGEELLHNSGYVGIGLAALGGGMAIAMLMRSGEEKVFDDVLKNARLGIAASLMGGAALGTVARLIGKYF